ncbi:MAG: sulfatase-like hydrolase/transferase [Anaerolineales bacterium]
MSSEHIQRRDFLKFIGAAGLYFPFSKLTQRLQPAKKSDKPNFLVLVFDTFTARHISLYGYQRKTTPNIERIAKRSYVYRHHYSASSHTKPSVSSLLTGVYPWSHRSLTYYTPLMDFFTENNLFSLMPPEYYKFAFTHNTFVTNILKQFQDHIDYIKPIEELALFNPNRFQNLFQNDERMGFYASKRWRDDYISKSSSLYINPLAKAWAGFQADFVQKAHKDEYPLGLSDNLEGYLYKLEDAVDWLITDAPSQPKPFLGYIHVLPPHEYYKPRADFLDMFSDDGVRLTEKPPHFFTEGQTQEKLERQSQLYDEYIALVDSEIGRLYDNLDKSGALENTYLLITSDHGQSFERGIHGHGQPVLYETNIHVPLMIHAPNQTEGKDIFTPTSLVDIAPTLLALAGQPVPLWSEGSLLPELGGEEKTSRLIYAMENTRNYKLKPLTHGTFTAIQYPYKFITYRGYEGFDGIEELYHLENDPEELENIAPVHADIVQNLKNKLDKTRAAAEKIYIGE